MKYQKIDITNDKSLETPSEQISLGQFAFNGSKIKIKSIFVSCNFSEADDEGNKTIAVNLKFGSNTKNAKWFLPTPFNLSAEKEMQAKAANITFSEAQEIVAGQFLWVYLTGIKGRVSSLSIAVNYA